MISIKTIQKIAFVISITLFVILVILVGNIYFQNKEFQNNSSNTPEEKEKNKRAMCIKLIVLVVIFITVIMLINYTVYTENRISQLFSYENQNPAESPQETRVNSRLLENTGF